MSKRPNLNVQELEVLMQQQPNLGAVELELAGGNPSDIQRQMADNESRSQAQANEARRVEPPVKTPRVERSERQTSQLSK